ncbi:MAG: hypothetical protein RIQ99_2156 [Pseudomonadota bacterium]
MLFKTNAASARWVPFGRIAVSLAFGLAALLDTSPAATAQSAPIPAPPAKAARFTPPTTPLILTRTIWRPLRDGKQIVVSRRYRIRFITVASGFRLIGTQIGVQVDAPAELASLAEIERRRIDTDLFPLEIDRSGGISAPQSASAAPNLTAALGTSRALIRTAGLPAAAVDEANRELGRMATSKASQWPDGTFIKGAPNSASHTEIVLPDGQTGRVDVIVQYQQAANAGGPRTVVWAFTRR